jgi:hypothetical protein
MMGIRIRQRDLDALAGLPWAWVQVAAHELGHWEVWKGLPGARVVRVRIWGSPTNPEGHTEMDWSRAGEDCDRGFLVGLLAGEEADKLWARATHRPRMRSGSSHDMAAFRDVRRKHKPSRQWSESHLRSEAQRLLIARWDDLVQRVPKLARTGHL